MLREERGELGLVHEIEAGKTSLFLYAIRLSSKDKKKSCIEGIRGQPTSTEVSQRNFKVF